MTRDELEQRIHDAVVNARYEWEHTEGIKPGNVAQMQTKAIMELLDEIALADRADGSHMYSARWAQEQRLNMLSGLDENGHIGPAPGSD